MVLDSFPDLCVADVDGSAAFYGSLLGLTFRMNHGWYVERDDLRALAVLRRAARST